MDVYGDAMREADTLLPGLVVTMLLEDGGSTYAMPPATVHRVSLQRGVASTVPLFKVPGRSLSLRIEASDDWTREDAGDAVVLESTGILTVHVQDPVSDELIAARRELDERRNELARRTGVARDIVATEVAQLEQQVRELQAEANASRVPLPPIPRIRGVDAAGRTFAEVKVTAK
jgi:hypothetical protein